MSAAIALDHTLDGDRVGTYGKQQLLRAMLYHTVTQDNF
jgi:hypothetical protein